MLPAPLIEQLAVALIGAGITLLLGLWYLRQKALTVRDEALALSHANTWNDFDALRLPGAAWPILQNRFLSLHVKTEWFGMPREELFGPPLTTGLPTLTRQLSVGDMSIDLTIQHKRLRGEQRYFASTLWEIFVLLMQMDLWIKSATISNALEQSAKAMTFARHDAKNYIQLVALLTNEIERLQLPNLPNHAGLKRIQEIVPMMETRGAALLASLGRGEVTHTRKQALALQPLLQELGQTYDLPCRIQGDSEAWAEKNILTSILENLFKNYVDHGKKNAELLIQIFNADLITLRFTQLDQGGAQSTLDEAALLRMFEPFWTTSAAGLGLGLYQARLQAREQGGDLQVEMTSQHTLSFILKIPHASQHASRVEASEHHPVASDASFGLAADRPSALS